MARGTSTASSKDTPTLWQKISGGVLATRWSQQENPPVGPDKAGFYVVALASGTLDNATQSQMARCLLWCDVSLTAFDPARFAWYKLAFTAFPQDERCLFLIAYLSSQKQLSDLDLTAKVYREILQPQWKDSKLWKRFALSKRNILLELAALYAEMPADRAEPEVVEIVEAALDATGEEYAGRRALITFLGRVYQTQGRTDEYAESAYRWIFNRFPDNIENCRYLAELYRDRGYPDNNVCVVYTHLTTLLDKEDRKDEGDEWVLKLAFAYIQMGQIHEGHLSTFERAARFKPDDLSITMAYLYALAHQYTTADGETIAARGFNEEQAIVTRLEAAVTRESDLRPIFESHGLEWSIILRSLAQAYRHQNRSDAVAQALYARAIWTCPEDVTVWALHATTLAEHEDYSEGALIVYEKVIHEPNCREEIFVALAHAYIGVKAEKDKARRADALKLWENLYRKGIHWPELIAALAEAYMAEDRINDTAIGLWEKQLASGHRNGAIRLRLAQELRQRGDLHVSLRYYKEAAMLLPKNFNAQFETGLVLKDHYADYASAIKLLQKAIKLPEGKTHLNAHFSLAEALVFCDKRAEAKVIFQKIIDGIDPEHTPTLLHLAKLNLKYEAEGVRQAEALYNQASTLSPNNAEAYRGMADLYREKGQAEEEEQALEKYLMLSEPDANRYRQLADLYIRKGDFIRAEGALRQVIALGQGDKRLYTLLGEVILQGRLKAAA
jgi:tetratricopeptide (TPR) repeat protein